MIHGRYRLRTTDLWINNTLRRHLQRDTRTQSFFGIHRQASATAMMGTILLHGLFETSRCRPGTADMTVLSWRSTHRPVSGPGVYPIGAWMWARLEALEDAFDLDVREDKRRQLLGSRHCFDALVAALTAREYANYNTYDPPEDCPRRC